LVSPDAGVVIEVFGEGRTDVGTPDDPGSPTSGVVPIFVHTLCGKPERMRVKRKRTAHLQGKSFPRKVWFAKRQASYNRSAAVVFVVDSEGDSKEFKKKMEDLQGGRDAGLPGFPMAVGVAHPCIESWLLADAQAIRRALSLPTTPAVPEEPETLTAPCRDSRRNPKTELAAAAGSTPRDLSSKDKDRIALALNDINLIRKRCPLSFAPFADEVEGRIRPLF
jgi:hypothetical protein